MPVITERVRVPTYTRCLPIQLVKRSLAHHELSHERLSIGHIQIRLQPHPTDQFPTAFRYSLLDLGIHRRVFIRHPLAISRRRLCVRIARILTHQLRRCAKRTLHHIDRFGPWPQPRGVYVRVPCKVQRSRLQQWPQRQQRRLRLLERSIKAGLIRPVKSLQVYFAHCLEQSSPVRTRSRRKRRNHRRRHYKLLSQVLRIRPIRRELNLQYDAIEVLAIHRLQQLDGYQNFVARLRITKDVNWLKVFAHRHAPSVEVDDLRNRAIRIVPEVKADLCSAKVITIQGLRHFDQAPKPHSLLTRRRLRLHQRPARIIQRRRLAMRHIARVKPPGLRRQHS